MCIVRHKKTNYLYKYLGDNIYQNIITDVKGEVSEETAKNIFAISLDATVLISEYPNIEKLIKSLELKIEIL